MSTAKHVAELIEALAKMRLENHELRLDDRRWRNARDIWEASDKRKDAEIERLKEMVAQYVVVAAEAQDGELAYKNFILSIKSLELRNVGEA